MVENFTGSAGLELTVLVKLTAEELSKNWNALNCVGLWKSLRRLIFENPYLKYFVHRGCGFYFLQNNKNTTIINAGKEVSNFNKTMDSDLYDEFGNYIGPDLSDPESEEEEYEEPDVSWTVFRHK